MKFKLAIFLILALVAVSCAGGKSEKGSRKLEVPSAVLTSQSDSLAYMIGVSMAQNLMKVDSLVDMEVVATAMVQHAKGKALFTPDNARTAYLKYMLHTTPEQQRNYETQYLKELSEKDRKYTRTRTGIIYNISKVGDESFIPRSNGDWVELNYKISRMDNSEELYSTFDSEPLKSALSDLPSGMQECVKLIGKGGQVSALIPSRYAYDGDGCDSLGIAPFETLRFDIELLVAEKNGANKHKKERDPNTF